MNALQKAALLTLLPSLPVIHSCTCMNAFREEFDARIDWHEFAYYLDELATKGLLTRDGKDRVGRCLYRLAQSPPKDYNW